MGASRQLLSEGPTADSHLSILLKKKQKQKKLVLF